MTALPRFYVPDLSLEGGEARLSADEARHLTRVMRLGAGDEIAVFDGRGHEFRARVVDAARESVRVDLLEAIIPAPEPHIPLTLVQAVLKGDKMDDVVRDAVMIGVTAIQPVVTARAEVNLEALERGRRRERWARIAVSSAKQCGRAVVPPIAEPVTLEVLIRTLLDSWLTGPALMLVEPGASKSAVTLRELDVEPPKAASIVIGPEGGWTSEEREAASVVCRLVTLGGRTIRADAMAAVALAALFARWGEF